MPRTIALASLVKGRWLDGTTQTVALLRPACDMSALFILQTFCRQDGGIATPLSPRLRKPFQNRTIPRPAPPHLSPLSKVRCCRPKKFGRLPEGLPHHSSQNRTIPPTFRRGVGLPLPLHRPSPSPQPLQKDNTPSLRTTFLPYERSACFAS